MSEKSNDGTVAMHIGEIEDAHYLAVEDYLPNLPNTVSSGVISFMFLFLLSLSSGASYQSIVYNFYRQAFHASIICLSFCYST